MKIRNGFVSNSSSSSFVCDVCGTAEAGWDGMYDIDVMYCDFGHEFCKSHYEGESKYSELDVEDCPICALGEISDTHVLKYLIKTLDTNKVKIVVEIQEKFSNLTELQEYLKH